MNNPYDLQRFVDAQESTYSAALSEVKNGRKRSHWMWFIFPQIQGLGFSETSRYFAIASIDEASAYLQHPVLGLRLVTICKELIGLAENNANKIFGYPDDLKLHSCLTLFASVPGADPVFNEALVKFFKGVADKKTLALLNRS